MNRLMFALILFVLLASFCASFTPQTQTPPPDLVQDKPAPATVAPTSPPSQIPPPIEARAYLTFVVNVHDWINADESADILLQLVDLFERYGVRGDFYFTTEVTRKLVEKYPKLIERFKNSNMTISYHVRPPHPLYTGFDERLKKLEAAALYQTILDYETYALDQETGDLDRTQPGGYTYVAQVFGRNPIVASPQGNDPRLKDAAQRAYAALGAQMILIYHEEGTKVNQPFEYVNGLLVRPSDFSVTRTTRINGKEDFWWNYMSAPDANKYKPTLMLQTQLAEWESHAYERVPFILTAIHENNFYRSGAESWSSIYFAMEKGKKTDPLSPPFNLNAPDPSRPRTAADKAAIFAAYEELVAYAAAHLQVVTSEYIVEMAK